MASKLRSGRRSLRLRSLLALSLASTGCLPALAADRVVGLVVEISGKPETVILERRGLRNLKLWDDIRPDDIIRIADKDTIVRLDVGRLPSLVIGGACSPPKITLCAPYAVKEAGTTFSTLLESVVFVLRKPPVAGSVNLLGRSAHPPKLAAAVPGTYLLAGRRHLLFPVVDGTPPYELTVSQASRTHGPFRGERHVAVPDIDLAAGKVVVRIVDSKGRASSTTITVVTRAPAPPAQAGSNQTTPRPLLLAAWMATRPDQLWKLEAVQQLTHNRDRESDELADALLARLIDTKKTPVRNSGER
jgi:hypothetical protein